MSAPALSVLHGKVLYSTTTQSSGQLVTAVTPDGDIFQLHLTRLWISDLTMQQDHLQHSSGMTPFPTW